MTTLKMEEKKVKSQNIDLLWLGGGGGGTRGGDGRVLGEIAAERIRKGERCRVHLGQIARKLLKEKKIAFLSRKDWKVDCSKSKGRRRQQKKVGKSSNGYKRLQHQTCDL